MLKLRISQRFIDAFLVLLLFCISGNPAFTATYPLGKFIYGLSLFLILLVSGFRIKVPVLKTCILWVIFLGVIFVAQYLRFRHITILGSLNLMAKMLCAILFASYLGERLPETAIKVMTIICITSLPFFLLNTFGVYFSSPIKTNLKLETIIIYTQNRGTGTNGLFRNSGLFWEPGAFAGYIIATIMLFTDRLRVLWYKYRREFIILSLTLLTTMSTTGYIVFALFAIYMLVRLSSGRFGILIAISSSVVLLFVFIYLFNNISFLGEKIEKELTITERITEEDADPSRSGSIIFDLQYIVSSPIFGNGLSNDTRFRFHLGTYDEDQLDGFGNGFSGAIASMGALFMLAYLLSIGLNRTLHAKWVIIVLVILLLQGEYYLNYPFFLMFPFIKYGPEKSLRGKMRRIKFVWNSKKSAELPS